MMVSLKGAVPRIYYECNIPVCTLESIGTVWLQVTEP